MRKTEPTDICAIVDNDGRQYASVESVPGALAAAKVMAVQYNKIFNVRTESGRRDLFRVTPIVRVSVENMDSDFREEIAARKEGKPLKDRY